MGVIHDSALECTECGNQEFKPEKRVTFHNKIREREFGQDIELPTLSRRIVYICAQCGHTLDK